MTTYATYTHTLTFVIDSYLFSVTVEVYIQDRVINWLLDLQCSTVFWYNKVRLAECIGKYKLIKLRKNQVNVTLT
jgi:hypothetical protein